MPVAASARPTSRTGLAATLVTTWEAMPAADRGEHRERHVGEAGLDGGVVQDLLHEEAGEEEQGHAGAEQQDGDDVGGAQRGAAEDAERHQRLLGAALDQDEGDEQERGEDEAADDPAGRDIGVGDGLAEGVDQRDQAAGEGDGTGDVEGPAAFGGAALADDHRGDQGADDADRHVDEEDPAPAGTVGEQTAEGDAGDGGETAERAPGAEGLVAGRALLEVVGQQAERGGGDERGSQALRAAGADQHRGVLGDPGEQGGAA